MNAKEHREITDRHREEHAKVLARSAKIKAEIDAKLEAKEPEAKRHETANTNQ